MQRCVCAALNDLKGIEYDKCGTAFYRICFSSLLFWLYRIRAPLTRQRHIKLIQTYLLDEDTVTVSQMVQPCAVPIEYTA